ncbi:unnamed protein product [Paramecium octaurelia]|uniref:Uncharacterized protein n=1 Tax=Paramecium octaurelia TaxID=43137 RepID=A0A8S1U6Q4_PAROT|nr:unnamed protein product [Paramecium octaurelia]
MFKQNVSLFILFYYAFSNQIMHYSMRNKIVQRENVSEITQLKTPIPFSTPIIKSIIFEIIIR